MLCNQRPALPVLLLAGLPLHPPLRHVPLCLLVGNSKGGSKLHPIVSLLLPRCGHAMSERCILLCRRLLPLLLVLLSPDLVGQDALAGLEGAGLGLGTEQG